jgi:hypothetical protein
MIVDWDKTNLYIYADNNGDFSTPVTMPMTYALETLIPHPFESGIYWYMRILTDIQTTQGTFPRVLVSFVLDSAHPPNAFNNTYGLDTTIVPYGVKVVTYYVPGLGELRDIDLDAGTGAVRAEYILQCTTTPNPSAMHY